MLPAKRYSVSRPKPAGPSSRLRCAYTPSSGTCVFNVSPRCHNPCCCYYYCHYRIVLPNRYHSYIVYLAAFALCRPPTKKSKDVPARAPLSFDPTPAERLPRTRRRRLILHATWSVGQGIVSGLCVIGFAMSLDQHIYGYDFLPRSHVRNMYTVSAGATSFMVHYSRRRWLLCQAMSDQT